MKRGNAMGPGLTKSRFYMWRAVVAMMHADQVVKPHEVNFILESTQALPISEAQMATLKGDIVNPASVDDLFHQISNPEDREDFFHLARAVAWSDGDFDEAEEALLERLQSLHFDGDYTEEMKRTQADFALYADDHRGALVARDHVVLKVIDHFLQLR